MVSDNDEPEKKITKEILSSAEIIAGLNFTNEEREQMLKSLNRFLSNYVKSREIKLEYNIEPPLYFNPQLPGTDYSREQNPIQFSKVEKVALPSNLEDIAFYSLSQLAWLLKEQYISSVELTTMYLERLKRFDPILECVITYTEDVAMKQAKQADLEISEGKYRGPLHGIPYGVKDALAYPGLPTTWGATPYKGQIINETATVIKRLEEAGAVMIAKLSMGTLGSDHIWFGGTTKSPWNIKYDAGGSSAGSAAATATGLVAFSIGTETWGSIIHPADKCGVTGLRPTYGRVSRYGVMTLSWTMDKIGPICRTVEDCALVFKVIFGSDGFDKSLVDLPFNWNAYQKLEELRIGYTRSLFEQERPYKEYDVKTLEVLKSLGVNLIPIKLPEISIQALYIIILAEAATFFEELTLTNRDDQLVTPGGKYWAKAFREARMIPAIEYIKANRIRRLILEEMIKIFTRVDVFVTPTIDHTDNFWTTKSNFLTNLTGHPAVVVPNGFKEDNMPTSITFIGDLYKEAEMLRIAKAYQDATEFHLMKPSLDQK
ncbi:MAG: amidase [Candidatus Hermodarchaeota archaeon]